MKHANGAARWLLAFGLALCASSLHAHDSWYARGDAGELVLVTGTRYPKVDLVVPEESIARKGCEVAGEMAGSARSCWAEFREFDISLDDKLVNVYLREARPAPAVLSRWQALRADGVAWQERYRKFVRIEIPGVATREEVARLRKPHGLALEIVPASDTSLRTAATARFVVLSQGKPVPGLDVELVSERSPVGAWARSDANGEVKWTLPFGGSWLVRTIAIEPDGTQGWRSRFATFAFDAG